MHLFDTLLARSLPIVPRPLVQRFARPYVAGESEADAYRTSEELNRQGTCATLDVLGEDVASAAGTEAAAATYRRLLDGIAAQGLDANVSVKLTQFGLKLDPALCAANLRSVLLKARQHDNFVRIDMEESSCTDATLALYREVVGEFPKTGVVLQAALKRTVDDARALASSKANVRVCKGIYVEPPRIAWTDREKVRESYLQAVEALLEGGSYVGFATHDQVLVEGCETLVKDLELPRRGRYEFQMLLGVREALRRQLVGRGHRLRVYVPFGADWYAYSLRRLRENPAIARHVARAILFGDAA